jgi:hypothetical protein
MVADSRRPKNGIIIKSYGIGPFLDKATYASRLIVLDHKRDNCHNA